jgi:hypothetical protein
METVLDAGALPPTLETIDTLARLRLRLQRPVTLRCASAELRALIELCGLDEVLRVEPRREAEEREERLRVEEEGELGDIVG